MTLREQQSTFLSLIPRLIDFAIQNGYELTLGDGYRDARVFGRIGERKGYGESRSNHKRRLAIDLNLFIDGQYQQTTEAHRPLGEFWESLDPHCSWGGRFNDGNHYEWRLGG